MGERELLVAIIMQAVKDYKRKKPEKVDGEVYPASSFIFANYKPLNEPALSFRNICHHLEISPGKIRSKLLKKKGKKSGKIR